MRTAYTLHAGYGLPHTGYGLLNPNSSTPSSLPWERVRERATSRKACIWSVRVLGKVAEIRGVPSPQPSPTGGGGRLQQIQALQVV